MGEELKVGQKYSVEHIVRDNETAIAYDSGAQNVYSTPALVAIMECAAFNMARDAGHETVGTIVNIEHKRACKPGSKVISTAELTVIDGNKLSFNVTVTDDSGNILGTGTHGRYIIDPAKFLKKLE